MLGGEEKIQQFPVQGLMSFLLRTVPKVVPKMSFTRMTHSSWPRPESMNRGWQNATTPIINAGFPPWMGRE
jgi:hypothetical protein